MLRVQDLRLDYDGVIGLAGVDIQVSDGEFVALVGANGAGKSSLLAAVAGLHRPVGGQIVFDGRNISALAAHEVARLGVALVPEGRHLFPRLSVRKNLMLGAYRQRNPGHREQDLERVLSLFPILEERFQLPAGRLSGGEQQMVALGRALMARPKLLMLDEPSLGVAPLLTQRIFEALKQVNVTGTTVLLVEQNLHAALRMSTRAYVLQTGRVVMGGSAHELSNSDDVKKAYLGL
jgi:branched-chain amino acid transport system ATP-binding protein